MFSPMRLRRYLKLEAVPVPFQASLFLNLCDGYVIQPGGKKNQTVWTLRLYESKIGFLYM